MQPRGAAVHLRRYHVRRWLCTTHTEWAAPLVCPAVPVERYETSSAGRGNATRQLSFHADRRTPVRPTYACVTTRTACMRRRPARMQQATSPLARLALLSLCCNRTPPPVAREYPVPPHVILGEEWSKAAPARAGSDSQTCAGSACCTSCTCVARLAAVPKIVISDVYFVRSRAAITWVICRTNVVLCRAALHCFHNGPIAMVASAL